MKCHICGMHSEQNFFVSQVSEQTLKSDLEPLSIQPQGHTK